jgi:superfamily II DNA or RNA helicase
VRDALGQGRKVLVLTERTEHLDAIKAALDGLEPAPFVLHGRMSRKQRAALVADLDALPPDAPRVLLSTGKLVGEGFDHPPLDTLVLAMPVSWKGTLQQYAGRLHREHASKTDVRIIDFRGYRSSGVTADVGQAAARLPGDGVQGRPRWPCGMTTNSPEAVWVFATTRTVPRARSAAMHHIEVGFASARRGFHTSLQRRPAA